MKDERASTYLDLLVALSILTTVMLSFAYSSKQIRTLFQITTKTINSTDTEIQEISTKSCHVTKNAASLSALSCNGYLYLKE